MPTRNDAPAKHQESVLESIVRSGQHDNTGQVSRNSWHRVGQNKSEDALRLEALRAAVKVGIDDIDAGRFKTLERAASTRRHLESLAGRAASEG